MKYLAVILCLVAGASFAGEHEIVLMDQYTIAAGETNTVETPYKLRGIVRQAVVYQDGSGVTTSVVAAIRSSFERTVSTIVANDSVVASTAGYFPLYDETVRFTTINYATNSVTVTPAIIYEK